VPHRPLRHLIVSREFPPASYAPGGIGTYAAHIAWLLAEAGETVHIIGERWAGAPELRKEYCGGRLVVHRVPLTPSGAEAREMGTASSAQRFAWQAALLAEALVDREGIDLVEAQEWEAPLYYFLLRRGLGLGPEREPPCIVHLHSPTELIYQHNEWRGRPEYLSAIRLEEFCIRSADAWLCPSRYLSRQVAARYGIPTDAISIIPYPQGDSAFVPREPGVWRDGRVLYVGRLEPRKGVIEFMDAAVEVARDHSTVTFDLVGEDVPYPRTLSVRRYLEKRIPRDLRSRFRFHGLQPRARLPEFLAAARVAVVPSRWENFPNTCIEAMTSGLPVIASPTGGMAEMLEDGVTGWIAASQAPPDLAAALRRALATPPEQLAAMGRAAAESIRGLCGNEITTRRHLAKRRDVARQGAPGLASVSRSAEPDAGEVRRHGLAIVVQAEAGSRSTRALDSIARLTSRPRALAAIEARDGASVAVLARAIRTMIDDHAVAGVALVPASVALEPGFLESCGKALARNPSLGILSGWTDHGPAGFVQPTPAFPYQWIADGIGDTAVIRAEAFLRAGGLREHLPLRYARWDLWNAVLAAGWKALAYSGVLATRERALVAPHRHGTDDALIQSLRERFPAEFARDAETVRSLETIPGAEAEPHVRDVFRLPLREQVGLVLEAVRQPRRALGWLRDHWSRKAR
jgi:glycogen(starch) synthase